MSGFIKNVYAFVNLGMAGFVMATVAVRFVFPGGVGRRRGVLDHPHRADLAARFPVVEVLDRARAGARADRGADDRRQRVPRRRSVPEDRRGRSRSCFMSFALVGLATGLGARYPRFDADNPSQVAGSYGGVAFMMLAVLFIIVMIVLRRLALVASTSLRQVRGLPLTADAAALMAGCFTDSDRAERGRLADRDAIRRPRALEAMSD